MARDDRPPATLAWTAAKTLLLGSLVALGATVWLLSRPLVNPGVQDCGTAAGFVFDNRASVAIRPGDADAPPDASTLAAQPTCRDRVDLQLRRAAVAGGAFFALGFLGALIGLIDDRIAYHRAPPFESLLRPLPDDAPVRPRQRVRIDEAELEGELPPVEPPQIVAYVAATVVGVGAVVAAAGVGATTALLGEVDAAPVAAVLAAVALGFVAGGAERLGAYTAVSSWVRALELVGAAAWHARIRPLVGWYGLDFHHLRQVGADRQEADREVALVQGISLLVHAVVLMVSVVLAAGAGPTDTWTRGVVTIGLVVALVVLGGAGTLPARVAGLPMRPRRAVVTLLAQRVGAAPGPLVVTVAAACSRPLLDGLALMAAAAAAGGGVGAPQAVAVAAVATLAGALTPIPSGAGVVEGTLFVGLVAAGMTPPAAAVAVVVYRGVRSWLPMVPGLVVSRRLRAAGGL